MIIVTGGAGFIGSNIVKELNRQVRLGQQHRAGDATGLAVVGRKGHPFVIHQGQATGVNLGAAQGGQGVGAQHVSRVASALVQISGQVQALHGNGAPPRAVAPSRATPPGARKNRTF